MSYMRDADGNRLDDISVKERLDAAEQAITAEAAAARNADNLSSGTIPDARIPAGIARDAEVTAAVSAEATARTSAIAAAIADLVNTAPGTLDTLKELADALGDDPNFAATIATALGTKATQADLTTEASTRAAADTTNANAITAEATARANADTALANADTAEATARATGDTTNATAIANEATARASADAALVAAADSRYLRGPGPAVIGTLGASITNNGTLSYYDKTLSGTVSYGSLNPFGFALPKTKGRFVAGGVAATNGYTTTQMIAIHLPNVLLSNWDYCVVGEVTNDLGNSFTIATTKANITTIITALLGARITPILTTVPPNDSNASGAGLTWITQYNEWIKRQARTLRVPIIDYHSVLVNPSTNAYAAGYSSDGTHPTANGAKVMGDHLADVLNAIPGPIRSALAPSYNPNLAIPDVCATSAGSDKITTSGSTAGGWAYAPTTSTKWKGNAPTVVRGSGDYAILWPETAGAMVNAHRMRLAFGIQANVVVGSGTWSAYLYNVTQTQVVAGYSAMTHPLDDGTSATATDAAVTNGSPLISCATSKPFTEARRGNSVAVLSGVSSRFAAGTTILHVAADGSTATASANANSTQSAQTLVVLGQPQVSCFEFDVQSDMVGDTFAFYMIAGGAAGAMVSCSQITLTDLTALGAV